MNSSVCFGVCLSEAAYDDPEVLTSRPSTRHKPRPFIKVSNAEQWSQELLIGMYCGFNEHADAEKNSRGKKLQHFHNVLYFHSKILPETSGAVNTPVRVI
jgi:hypothetical protein